MFNLILLSFAGLFSGISQIANKKIAKPEYPPESLTVATMLLNALIAFPLLFYQFEVSLDWRHWLLTAFSTIAFAFSTKFLFKAYNKTDVSLVLIIYKLNVVIVAIIGIILLKETYNTTQSLGLFLILISSISLVFKPRTGKLLPEGIIYVVLAAILTSFASVSDKIILNHFSPFTYAFINNAMIAAVFMLKKNVVGEAITIVKKDFKLLFIGSLFMTIGFVFILVALQLGDVSKILPVYSGLGLLIPVLIGIIFLNERQEITKKLIASIVIILGSWLLIK